MRKPSLVQSLAFGLLLAVLIASGWHLMLEPKVTSDQPPQIHANNIQASAAVVQPNTKAKIASDNKNQSALLKTTNRALSEQDLAELIDRRLLPTVRDELNNYLRPHNQLPHKMHAIHGSSLEF